MGTAADASGQVKALPLLDVESGVAAIAKPQRWLALDLVRFLAVLLMVQGHTFYEVLAPEVTSQYWYRWHGYVHGFTAPMFLFSSGMAFGITTLGHWQKHLTFGATVMKRVERYVILIALGYLLQGGAIGLSYLRAAPPEEIDRIASINALQHIGLVLLVCELLPLLLRKKAAYLAAIGALLAISAALGPFAWNLDVSSLSAFSAAWINHTRGSLFPIVPWSGFIFAGILVAGFVEWRRRVVPRGLMQLCVPLAVLGALLIVGGDRLAHMSWQPFPEHYFWKANPWWLLIRLGVVLSVLSGLALLDWALGRITHQGGLQLLQTVGSQTLVIYVAHLVLIYGQLGITGLQERFPHSLDVGESTLLVVSMLAALAGLAWLWERTKTRHKVTFDRTRYAVIGLVVLQFFVR